jgi:hypothetical protein
MNQTSLASAYPPEAICDVDGCQHRNDNHDAEHCEVCLTNVNRGYKADPHHAFVPRKYAGGAYTPSAEKELYDRIMRDR